MDIKWTPTIVAGLMVSVLVSGSQSALQFVSQGKAAKISVLTRRSANGMLILI